MIWPAVVGLCIVALVLLEAFETIILPRRVSRRFRLTRAFYLCLWVPTRAFARLIRSPKRRETFLSFFGPLSLLVLFAVWATLLILGFGFTYYSDSHLDPTHPGLQTCFYISGTTFFTLGLGDFPPHTSAERVFSVFESGLGFGFLALIISYLPVIYQAFSKREVSIVLLDARAGSPPTAGELLLRHNGPHGLEALQELFRDWERWSAELLESHISYPVVSYFRSQHTNESWLAALAALLDSTALLIAMTDGPCTRQARLTFAMCRHTVADLAQVFVGNPQVGAPDRLPPEQFARLRTSLTQAGFEISADEASLRKLGELREMYEPYLHALSRYLFAELPPWILSSEITENWKRTAWGRISGISSRGHAAQTIEDHF
ncbi:MAG: potassium channel family protein [Candidatus Acidiferrales bacterium]